MKVLITTDIFPPEVGGPATSVPALAASFAHRAHRVTVLTWSRVPWQPEDEGYPFALCRVRRRNPRALRLAQLGPRLIGYLRNTDVVYVCGQLFPVFLLNRILRRPAVAKVVGDLAWEYLRQQTTTGDDIETFQHRRYGPAVEWRRRLRAAALRRMDAVVVPSAYLARLVAGWGVPAERIRVIPNAWQPVEDARPIPVPPPGGRPLLVTVCRLTAWKGVDDLIEAVAELPGVELAVVGDGPERAALEALAIRRGCRDRVIFTGVLPRAKVDARLRASDLFVLNSRYEGSPHAVLEAYAAGLPVITAASGGTPEVVRHNVTGLLVPPGDVGALRQSIRALLSDAALRERLIGGGRELLAHYSVDAMADSTESLLLEVSSLSASATAQAARS